MSSITFEDRLPILQLGQLNVDLRRYSYLPADFSSYFPPHAAHQWNYAWQVEEDGEEFREMGTRCQGPLCHVVQRLNLMGWSEAVARKIYDDHTESRHENPALARFDIPPRPSFDSLIAGVAKVDVNSVPEGHPIKGKLSPWHTAVLHAVEFDGGGTPTKLCPDPVEEYRTEIQNLDTATMLHLLAKNEDNLSIPVTWWSYNEVIEESRLEEDYDRYIGAKRPDQVIIVTEGKSDTNIIRHAFRLLRTHIEDFYSFIDMEENYPFTGAGNLLNFYKGLHKIDIMNNMIFIFDNDTEGLAKFNEANSLPPKPNIRSLILPDHPALHNIATLGPTGKHYSDINRRAASIETLLDLAWKTEFEPTVHWTSFQKISGEYQGELVDKVSYTKRFLELDPQDLGDYDTTKIEVLLDQICKITQEMAEVRLFDEERYQYWYG